MKYKSISIIILAIFVIILINSSLTTPEYIENRDSLIRVKINDINIKIEELSQLNQ